MDGRTDGRTDGRMDHELTPESGPDADGGEAGSQDESVSAGDERATLVVSDADAPDRVRMTVEEFGLRYWFDLPLGAAAVVVSSLLEALNRALAADCQSADTASSDTVRSAIDTYLGTRKLIVRTRTPPGSGMATRQLARLICPAVFGPQVQ